VLTLDDKYLIMIAVWFAADKLAGNKLASNKTDSNKS
jgi:hypothetical protein